MSNLIQEKDFSEIVEFLKSREKDFLLLLSKNSQVIIYNDKKYFFTEKKLNPKIFSIAKELKNEADIILHYTPELFPKKDRGMIRYYNYQPLPSELKRGFFIDLKSAYITLLNNKKIISNPLFEKINAMKKKDRLISLGMLAYEPYQVTYIAGQKDKIKRIENKYSQIFYYACVLTQDIMEILMKKIEKRYLFFWVDGLFFENWHEYNLIKDILKSKKLNFSHGSFYNFISKKKRFSFNYGI